MALAYRPGTLLFCVPIFAKGTPATDVANRRGDIEGWVVASIAVEHLVKPALAGYEGILNGYLHNTASGSHQWFLKDQESGADMTMHHSYDKADMVSTTLMIGGRQWQLHWVRPDSFNLYNYVHAPLILLTAGMVISFLLFGVLWSLMKTKSDLELSAFQDKLTGLANRAVFNERLEHAIA